MELYLIYQNDWRSLVTVHVPLRVYIYQYRNTLNVMMMITVMMYDIIIIIFCILLIDTESFMKTIRIKNYWYVNKYITYL